MERKNLTICTVVYGLFRKAPFSIPFCYLFYTDGLEFICIIFLKPTPPCSSTFFLSTKWREQCCQDYLRACPSSSLTEIDQHLKVWRQAPKTLKTDWFKRTVVKNQQHILPQYLIFSSKKKNSKFALKLSMTSHWPSIWILHSNIFKRQLQRVKYQTLIAAQTRNMGASKHQRKNIFISSI